MPLDKARKHGEGGQEMDGKVNHFNKSRAFYSQAENKVNWELFC